MCPQIHCGVIWTIYYIFILITSTKEALLEEAQLFCLWLKPACILLLFQQSKHYPAPLETNCLFLSRWCTCSHRLRPPAPLPDYTTQNPPRRSPLALRCASPPRWLAEPVGSAQLLLSCLLTVCCCCRLCCCWLLSTYADERRRHISPSVEARGALHFPPRRWHRWQLLACLARLPASLPGSSWAATARKHLVAAESATTLPVPLRLLALAACYGN